MYSKVLLTTSFKANDSNLKWVTRSRESKDRQCNDQKKKGQKYKLIYKTPHKKLNIEQHEPHLKTGCEFRCTGRVNSSYSTCGTRLTNHTINDHGGEFVSQYANPLCETIDIHLNFRHMFLHKTTCIHFSSKLYQP